MRILLNTYTISKPINPIIGVSLYNENHSIIVFGCGNIIKRTIWIGIKATIE